MTTISASSPPFSPRQRLLDQVSAKEQSGAIGATDAEALSRAIDDIDQTLSQGASGTRPARLDPSEATSRIDDLIAGEVDKGTLTGEQAETLKGLLSQQGPQAGGPVGGVASSTSTASGSRLDDLLSNFLKQIQDAQSPGQATRYGATGSSGGTVASALLVDFQA
ncbi:hypothetical protein [Methylobacterium sp. ID0610]|uniref:hypothetical protein n=1 Tax=Methylobacterium carpenticola TaxID=3344827 RepID=UPI0036ADC884